MPSPTPNPLLAADAALRSRFEDFRRALDRRDEEAYRLALSDFLANLRTWSGAVERVVVPAFLGATDHQELARELRLDLVQLRELTRYVLDQLDSRARMSDVLGLVENLDHRLDAHGRQTREVYAPAAERVLDESAWAALAAALPPG